MENNILELEKYQPVIIPEIATSPDTGLTSEQVSDRMINGYSNVPVEPPTKSVWQIIRKNLFTYFNIIFLFLQDALSQLGHGET